MTPGCLVSLIALPLHPAGVSSALFQSICPGGSINTGWALVSGYSQGLVSSVPGYSGPQIGGDHGPLRVGVGLVPVSLADSMTHEGSRPPLGLCAFSGTPVYTRARPSLHLAEASCALGWGM